MDKLITTPELQDKSSRKKSSQKYALPFHSLPTGVLLNIISFLPITDLYHLSLTCKSLHVLCQSDEVFEPKLELLHAAKIFPTIDLSLALDLESEILCLLYHPNVDLSLSFRKSDHLDKFKNEKSNKKQVSSVANSSESLNDNKHTSQPATPLRINTNEQGITSYFDNIPNPSKVEDTSKYHLPLDDGLSRPIIWPALVQNDDIFDSDGYESTTDSYANTPKSNNAGALLTSPSLSTSSSSSFQIESADKQSGTVTAFVPNANTRIVLDEKALDRMGTALILSDDKSVYKRGPKGTAKTFFFHIYKRLLVFYNDLMAKQKESILFGTFSNVQTLSIILRRLAIFYQFVQKSKDSFVSSYPIDSTIDWFESTILNQFEQAYDNGNTSDMAKFALSAYNLNGGKSCVNLFISKNPIFFDSKFNPALLTTLTSNNISRKEYGKNRKSNKTSKSSSFLLVDEFSKYSEHILSTCNSQANIISKVFLVPSMNALTLFAVRLFDESIFEYLSTILTLSRENSETIVFLHLLANGVFFFIQFLESIANNKFNVPVHISRIRKPVLDLCTKHSSNFINVSITNLEERLLDLIKNYDRRYRRRSHKYSISNSNNNSNDRAVFQKNRKTSNGNSRDSTKKSSGGFFSLNISGNKYDHTLLSSTDDLSIPVILEDEERNIDYNLNVSVENIRKSTISTSKKNSKKKSMRYTDKTDVGGLQPYDDDLDEFDKALSNISMNDRYFRQDTSEKIDPYMDDIDIFSSNNDYDNGGVGDSLEYSDSDSDHDYDQANYRQLKNNQVIEAMKSVLFAPITLGKNLASIGKSSKNTISPNALNSEPSSPIDEDLNDTNTLFTIEKTSDGVARSARSQKLLKQINALESLDGSGIGAQSYISIELCIQMLQEDMESLGRTLIVLSAVDPMGVESGVAKVFTSLLEVSSKYHLKPAFDRAILKLDEAELLDDVDENVEDETKLANSSIESSANDSYNKDKIDYANTSILSDTMSIGSSNNYQSYPNPRKYSDNYSTSSEIKKTVAPSVLEFFGVVQASDVVQQMFDIYYQEDIRQWVNENDQNFLTELGLSKKKFDHILDDCVATGMDKCLRIMVNQLEYIYVLDLDPLDYNPEASLISTNESRNPNDYKYSRKSKNTPVFDIVVLDVKPTKLCRRSARLFKEYWSHVVKIADRQMVEVFFIEASVRIFEVIVKHLKRIQISQSGAQQLICDFGVYYEWSKSTRIQAVIDQFSTLKELASIFLADGTHELRRIVADISQSRNSHIKLDDLHELLRSRNDYKRIHKNLQTSECSIQ